MKKNGIFGISRNHYFVLLLLLIVFNACGTAEESRDHPNILWISHEDLSPIYGCYGDSLARTPHIDRLAKRSIKFNQAFSNAPICAPARSTLITGMYAISLGSQHLRSETPVPESMKILPEVLREAGYYTSNNVKTDYNFSHEGRWDESSNTAHWRNRPEGKPFFSVFNFMITHEGPTNALRDSDTESLSEYTDPEQVRLPPYLPDSPKMRKIWAHMYDLLAVFDQEVADLLQQLEADGLLEETIVFVFSDHGHGLPGHKRWLNNAGLQIPFILHVPEKYKHLVNHIQGTETEIKVGFVDFAPTVIHIAGAEVPELMEGTSFLGNDPGEKKYVFGYRDRADDCYEVSRSVYDGRYLYVRHFMPQLPYFQNALIFNKGGSYEEINRIRDLGSLPEQTRKMFEAKEVELLYDLKNDPLEQTNLINEAEFSGLIQQLSNALDEWMVRHRDTGLITEGIMMQEAKNTSIYEVARSYSREKYQGILDVAKMAGKVSDLESLQPYFEASDPSQRFWALIALDAYEGDITALMPELKELMLDEVPAVAIKAAEIMAKRGDDPYAFTVLENMLKLTDEVQVLQAAISVRQLGEKAAPLLTVIQDEIFPKYAGDIWGRYKSWSYPMFIGMALDQTQINCGIAIDTHK
ncbi:sulfatase-like hydrolase/transferase [Cyclobacterium sp.]|uniref:sulfatase-like hydrolase/transferase n=1 Tax=Cyclobacterium sp. TaxID=1966343 RepID=UPI00198ACBA7|nr:sulfatase-like hydrolase/transferase [Cyclobacterium sp.]MBD3628222.1 sulfatase [Cyclobacterium sp.]